LVAIAPFHEDIALSKLHLGDPQAGTHRLLCAAR
jgi:hypothetical protein